MTPENESKRPFRVVFSRGIPVQLLAIDGTWSRAALMLDVGEEGAKLKIESLQGLQLKEFFLVLSSNGTAFRRCELAWINGDEMGVSFIRKHECLRKSLQPKAADHPNK